MTRAVVLRSGNMYSGRAFEFLQWVATIVERIEILNANRGGQMDILERVATKEFLDEWRTAFKDIRKVFVSRDRSVKLSSKREKNDSLWTKLEEPYPGIRLVAIEMKMVLPLTIYLKVWVYQSETDLYEKLRSARVPQIRGRSTVAFDDQNAPPSYKSSLKGKGQPPILGLRYNVDDVAFPNNESETVSDLREIGDQFCTWLLANASSNTTGMDSDAAVPFSTIPLASEQETISFGMQFPTDSDDVALSEEIARVEGTAEAVESVENDQRFTKVGAKTRLALVNARIGQGGYRKRMLHLWGDQCALTGCDIQTALIASHAMPWRECSIEDCLNAYNGLLLIASLDRLFDAGLISFGNDGALLKHPSLTWAQLEQLGFTASSRLRSVDEQHWRFLASHRAAHGFCQ